MLNGPLLFGSDKPTKYDGFAAEPPRIMGITNVICGYMIAVSIEENIMIISSILWAWDETGKIQDV